MSSVSPPTTLPSVPVRATDDYASDLTILTNAISAAIQEAPDEALRRKTSAEGWPVVVVAHHACMVQGFFASVFEALLAGDEIPTFSSADVDHNNAAHADKYANVSRKETLACLAQSSAELIDVVRRLSPEQLESVIGSMAGFEMTGTQILEFALIGHFREHLSSIEATLANK